MRFLLNKEKAAQASAYLISLNGGRIDLYLLMKLIYLADREAIVQNGTPITGARMVSMEWGPILSEVYDATKPIYHEEPWSKYIAERDGNDLSLATKSLQYDELSRFELRILREIYQEHGHKDFEELKAFVHALPEYTPTKGSLPIDPLMILRSSGKSEDEIAELAQLAEEVYLLKILQSPVS